MVRPPRATTLTSASPIAAGTVRPPASANIAGISTSTSTVNRSSTTSQPTAMCPVGVCSWRLSESTRMRTTVLATDSATPKTMPAAQAPAGAVDHERAERGGDQALHDRAGDRDAPDGEQILDVELQADAEHQQDDADLGELLGERAIGDEPGRVRADDEPGDEVADDRRELQPLGDVAADQRRDEAAGEREDQIEAMHAALWLGPRATMGRGGASTAPALQAGGFECGSC